MRLFENLRLLLLARSRIGFSRKNVIFVKFRETVEPRNGAKFRVLQRHFYDFEGHTLICLRSYISWILASRAGDKELELEREIALQKVGLTLRAAFQLWGSNLKPPDV